MQSKEFELALEALEEQRFKDAAEILERLLDQNGNDPEILVYLGLAYLQDEQPERAIEVLLDADEQVEDHCVVAQFLGRAYKSIHDYPCAITYLKRAIHLDDNLYEAWLDLAEVLYFTRRYGEAIRILDKAVRKFSRDPALHALRAMAFYRLGDYTEATREWGVVSDLRPNSILALTNYAFSLFFIGEDEKAQEIVDKVLHLNPGSYRTNVLSGELAFHRGEYESAARKFERAIEMYPDSIEALSRMAVVLYKLGQTESAQQYLKQAKELVDKNPYSWQRLCHVHEYMEKYDELIECIDKIVAVDTSSAAAWIRLAVEYERRGQVEEAKNAWIRSIKLRGYVKAYCEDCQQHIRIPIVDTYSVNLDMSICCSHCEKELPLPECLSRI